MLDTEPMIVIAQEFSDYPAGRIDDDGDFNGTKFREEILVGALRKAIEAKTKLFVSLDGLKSCGSSFLEEAFGGLVRKEHFDKKALQNTLEIQASEERLMRFKEAIYRYIDNAKPEQK